MRTELLEYRNYCFDVDTEKIIKLVKLIEFLVLKYLTGRFKYKTSLCNEKRQINSRQVRRQSNEHEQIENKTSSNSNDLSSIENLKDLFDVVNNQIIPKLKNCSPEVNLNFFYRKNIEMAHFRQELKEQYK
jgi:hypothetical protein